jgi:membrane-bound ClpP family serine protease
VPGKRKSICLSLNRNLAPAFYLFTSPACVKMHPFQGTRGRVRAVFLSGKMNTSIVTAIFLTSALFIALLVLIAAASRHKKRSAGALRLIGRYARVETDLRPEGAVIVDGELWRARLSGVVEEALLRGSRVRVIGASGYLLEVEPENRMISGR